MEAKTLINLLNYSKTLIQNGEIKYLYYEQSFIRPENVGAEHSETIEDLKQQLREEPLKSQNPEALRKAILIELEKQKKYGAFRDSNELFSFVEVNLIFQPQYAYRMEVISRFERYPSFNAALFFGGGGQFYRFSNSVKQLNGGVPGQFSNSREIGYLEVIDLEQSEDAFSDFTVNILTNLPSLVWYPLPTDEDLSKVYATKDSDDVPVYVITSFFKNGERRKKIYVKLKDGLPEVFREEMYHKHDSPLSDTEGYRLSSVRMYSDFERVETLNIAVPKVIEERMFSFSDDEFLERRIIVIIKEMDFNLELPTNFFDWDVLELTGDNDRHEKIRGDVKKEESQETQK